MQLHLPQSVFVAGIQMQLDNVIEKMKPIQLIKYRYQFPPDSKYVGPIIYQK